MSTTSIPETERRFTTKGIVFFGAVTVFLLLLHAVDMVASGEAISSNSGRASMDHPELEEMIEDARTLESLAKREVIYREASKFVVDNVLQIVPLNFSQIVVANEKAKNIEQGEWKNSACKPFILSIILKIFDPDLC